MVERQIITDDYAIYLGDCVETLKTFPDESIHLSVYSPPFGGLFHYSSDIRDISNSDNYEDFFKHYEYLIREKYRLTLKGRMSLYGGGCPAYRVKQHGCERRGT